MSISESLANRTEPMSPLEERATIIGYFGLIPFMLGAFVLWLAPSLFSYSYAGAVMKWSLYYAAIILSFMGGVRWGLALLNDKKISDYVTISQLTWSVIPALVAWIAVIPENVLPGIAPNFVVRHLLLLLAFGGLLWADLQAARDGFAPSWYGPMRLKLTFFVSMALILTTIKLLMLGW